MHLTGLIIFRKSFINYGNLIQNCKTKIVLGHGSMLSRLTLQFPGLKLKRFQELNTEKHYQIYLTPLIFFEELSKNESLKLLLNAIYELDEIDRSIMLLYLDEKSYDEIAEIIGISKSNVGVRISRAKESIKQNIKN